MSTITKDRAANDNLSPASLLAAAKWNERESIKGRHNRATKNRMAAQAVELRAVAAEMRRVG
jgi:hypothetical protein